MPRAGLDSKAVVAAAAELADDEGLEAVTLARVADRLGVRSPSLYGHVNGLSDLRRRLGARGARELSDALVVAAAGKSRLRALRALAETYRAFAQAHPGTYAAMQSAPDEDAGELAAAGRDLVAVIVAVLDGYSVGSEETIHAVRVVRSALHGFVSIEREQGFQMPFAVQESFERLIAVLDKGLSGGVFATGAPEG